ncbi:lisH domain and HEAT repeat-containing protein KIAA1468-like [Pitangus sulphuratus]|nr:lisH domain and HEAT repeat-containing protein KIAA1468-like [Pitangus sulphuratus]
MAAAAAGGGGGSVNPFLSDSEEDEPEEARAGGGSSSSTEPGGPAYPQPPAEAAGSPEELPGLRAAAPGDAAAGAGEPPRVPMDAIAAQLLRDQLLLTALELHTELLESGRELPRLRDFFSNPGNFERQSGTPPAGGALGSLGSGSGLGGAGGREPGAGQLSK